MTLAELETFPGRRSLEVFGNAGLETRGRFDEPYAMLIAVGDEADHVYYHSTDPVVNATLVAGYDATLVNFQALFAQRTVNRNVRCVILAVEDFPGDAEAPNIIPPERDDPPNISITPRAKRPVRLLDEIAKLAGEFGPKLVQLFVFLETSGSMPPSDYNAAQFAGSQFLEQMRAFYPSLLKYTREFAGQGLPLASENFLGFLMAGLNPPYFDPLLFP